MKNRGFTLIELILVLGILLIFTSVSILHYGVLEQYQAKQELKQLIQTIERTKNDALIHHYSSSVNIFSDGYSVKWKNESWERKFPQKLKITYRNISSISFNESGRIAGDSFSQNSAGRIVFQAESKYYTITISPVTGRIILYKGQHNGKETGFAID